MWKHVMAGGLVVGLLGCAAKAPDPPALPEEPVMLEEVMPPPLDKAEVQELPPQACDYKQLRETKRQRRPRILAADERALPPVERPAKAMAPAQVIMQGLKQAEVVPTLEGYAGKQAIYRFRYTPGKVYVIYTHPSVATRLYFPRGETVVTHPLVSTDEKTGWEYIKGRVGPEDAGQDVYAFRPLTDETKDVTTGVDLASGRSIYFRLVVGKVPMLGVTWDVPHELEAESEPPRGRLMRAEPETTTGCPGQDMRMPIELAQLHTAYKVEPKGPVGFLPTQVFDDGKKTLVRFRQLAGNMPTVFTYKPNGERGLVYFTPYRVPQDPSRGTWYVIDNIWPKIELVGTDGQMVLITRLTDVPAVAVAERPRGHQ